MINKYKYNKKLHFEHKLTINIELKNGGKLIHTVFYRFSVLSYFLIEFFHGKNFFVTQTKDDIDKIVTRLSNDTDIKYFRIPEYDKTSQFDKN